MKVWVTKYALTLGILEYDDAEDCSDRGAKKMVMVKRDGYFATYFHNDDWHTTQAAAVAQAELMRQKKIVSLEKTLKKLNKMKF